MAVNGLLRDAEYGISRLNSDPEHFDFNFRGVLATLKGVLDQMLEEYNSKIQARNYAGG